MSLLAFVSSLRIQPAEQKLIQFLEGLLWTAIVAALSAGAHLALGNATFSWNDVAKVAGAAFVLAIGNGLLQLSQVAPLPTPPAPPEPPVPPAAKS